MTRRGSAAVADGAIRAIVLDFNGTLAQDDHLVAALEQMLALGWKGRSADGR
jgi:hypothetical protein